MAITGRSFPSHHTYIRNPAAPAQQGQGQAQVLVGTIACNLAFDYASGAIPNDSSPLNVFHPLQGPIICNLIFSPFGGILNDTSNLNILHTLQGTITLNLIYTYTSGGQLLDSASLNVIHTATSNIITQVNITGGSVDQVTTQSSVACLAILSAQLAVAHTLQGSIDDLLIFTYTSGGQLLDSSNLNVAHNAISTIAVSSSFTGNNNLNESSQTGITDVNTFSGILNVFHPLAGSVITILGFSDSFAVAHTLDNGGINGSTGLTDSFFTVFHTLQGTIAINLGISGTAGAAGGGTGGIIVISGAFSGSLNVFHPLQGGIDDILIMSGGSNIAITGAGSITNIGTIIENVNVAHTLQGSITDVLTITASDLGVNHPLQGTIDCYCKLDQSGIIIDEEQIGSLNVKHTLIGGIDGSLGFSANLNAGATGNVIIVGSFTGDLGVFHTLQGKIDDVLVMSGGSNIAITGSGTPLITLTIVENLNVAHTLSGRIDTSLGFSGTVGAGGGGGGTIIIAGSFTGDLGVFHPLQSEEDNISQLIGNENTGHTLDNNGITLISIVTTSDLKVAHTLQSQVIIISSGGSFLSAGNNGNIVIVSIVTGSLTNTITLQGTIADSLIITIPIYLKLQNIGTIPAGCAIVGNLNVAHTLISFVSSILIITGTIKAGAPTVTFPGDFIVIPRHDTLLFAPIRVIRFGNLKRIIRLFVPSKPGRA